MKHLALVAALASTTTALLNCDITLDGVHYDLRPLGDSEHSVVYSQSTPPTTTNTTWFINPCNANHQEGSDFKLCPEGTQICGVQYVKPENQDWLLTGVIPVSGDLNGEQNGATITALTSDDGYNDPGIRVHMQGGAWGDVGKLDALVDFVCTKEPSEEKLEFLSWDLHTLKLLWKTRRACADIDSEEPPKENPKQPDEKKPEDGDKPKDDNDVSASGGWGWFTWLFILVVLGSAIYIIGSAWANYSRYGHIGVDSNHTEFLREIPFLVKDFVRKIAGTFSGGSNRGGYSAV